MALGELPSGVICESPGCLSVMTDHPNVQRIRDSYSALDAGDLSNAFQYLAPAGVIHFNRRGSASRNLMGMAAISTALVKDYILTAGTQKFHIKRIFANDHFGVVLLRQTASRPDGATLDLEGVHLLAFDSEGRLHDLWDIPSDREAQAAFFEPG
jgi:uncharacterized protein